MYEDHWPILYGPEILLHIFQIIWWIKVIFWDNTSVWHRDWPHEIYLGQWPIFPSTDALNLWLVRTYFELFGSSNGTFLSRWSFKKAFTYEPRHNKTNKVSVSPVKISLGIRPVWSESSLSAWRNLRSLATHWAHSKDSDQTGRMPRLIWVFAGRTLILLVLSCRVSYLMVKQKSLGR